MIPSKTIVFSFTQLGLCATLPIWEVTEGHYIALLGCSIFRPVPNKDGEDASLVCLTLQDHPFANVNELTQSSVYHRSWSKSCDIILIPFDLSSQLQWVMREINISLGPAYREGSINVRTKIARLMASSPQSPFQFTAVAVTAWETNHDMDLVDVWHPEFPWTGLAPVTMFFKHRYTSTSDEWWATLTVGCCPGPPNQFPNNRGSQHTHHAQRICLRGRPYAVWQHYRSDPRMVPHFLILNQSCVGFHLNLDEIPSYPKWTAFPIERSPKHMMPQQFKFRSRRSLDGIARVLEVEMEKEFLMY